MLANLKKTRGYENKQQVEIYETEIVANQGEIDLEVSKGTPKAEIPAPKMKKVVYISAGLPQANSRYEGPIRRHHQESFPQTWKAFQEGQESANIDGIPLSEIPGIQRSVINEYEKLGVETVEQLIDVDDNTISAIPHGLKMRERAKQTLDLLTDKKIDETADKVAEMEEALTSFKEEMSAERDADKKEIEELKAKLAAAEKKPAKKSKKTEG